MSDYEYYAHRYNPIWVEVLRDEFMRLGPYWWMAWNVILAIIPVVLAILFLRRRDQLIRPVSNWMFSLQALVVLLFLPNAPYVVTDMVHFLETVRLTDHGLWRLLIVEFPLYIGFIGFGLFCYSFTVDRLYHAVKIRFGRRTYWVLHVAVPLLNAIGIYLGRVSRFNTWDVLIDPLQILREAVITDVEILAIIGIMTIALYITHLGYKIMHDGLRIRLMRLRARRASLRRLSGWRGAARLAVQENPGKV